MIKYSDDPLMKLKDISPSFYKLYNYSVFVAYLGFIMISWYFINLAYTINTPSYDILCMACTPFSHLVNISLLVVWVFFLYFYIINEIRFRLAHYTGRTQANSIKKNNLIFTTVSAILAIITLFIIL